MERIRHTIWRAKGSVFALIIIAFLILLSQECSAQIAFGPKAGFAITTFEGTDAQNVESRTSGLGGVFVNFELARWFAIQPELLISQKGATYYSNSNNTRKVLDLNYFEVPVLAKLRFPIDRVFYPHLLAGPNFAFNTNARYTATDSQNGTTVTGLDTDYRKTDVGAIVGAGVDIQSKRLFVTLDGRYGYAFNNLNNDNSSQLRIRNAGWTFSLGVGIRLFADNDD